MTTILEVFDIADIRIAVVRLLDPVSIIRLSATCEQLRDVFCTRGSKQWNIGRWDIDAHLKRFVSDPKLFRGMLGRCGAIVSGSNALQFLDGVCYPDSDMDVFFDNAKSLAEFGEYLTLRESYVYDHDVKVGQPPDWAEMRSELNVDPYVPHKNRDYRVFSVEDLDRVNLEVVCFSQVLLGQKIQLIWSPWSVLKMVLRFDSTLVMNFYTWNASYALFPWLTFYERRGIKSGRFPTEAQQKRDTKYAKRGFTLVHKCVRNQQWELVEEHGFRRRRALVDHHTWCLPFDTAGVDRPLMLDTVPLDMTFKLQVALRTDLYYGKVKRDGLLLKRILSMSYGKN